MVENSLCGHKSWTNLMPQPREQMLFKINNADVVWNKQTQWWRTSVCTNIDKQNKIQISLLWLPRPQHANSLHKAKFIIKYHSGLPQEYYVKEIVMMLASISSILLSLSPPPPPPSWQTSVKANWMTCNTANPRNCFIILQKGFVALDIWIWIEDKVLTFGFIKENTGQI